MTTLQRSLVCLGLALNLALGAPAWADGVACDSLASPAGSAWAAANAWRYPDTAGAGVAYRALVDTKSPSPWPDWFQPVPTLIKPGTRFQMALGSDQVDTSGKVLKIGGFATYQPIGSAADVWNALAVRSDFKSDVAWVATLEVTRDLPAAIGPIGPQVEPRDCHLLPGGWTQVELLVPPETRMFYVRVVDLTHLP